MSNCQKTVQRRRKRDREQARQMQRGLQTEAKPKRGSHLDRKFVFGQMAWVFFVGFFFVGGAAQPNMDTQKHQLTHPHSKR